MCRTGGRRCPSHSDPVLVANRNARRRQAYAAIKQRPVEAAVNSRAPLTEESYKDFGFLPAKNHVRAAPIPIKDQVQESMVDTSDLTDAERAAASMFTSNNYLWINGTLHNRPSTITDVFVLSPYDYPDKPKDGGLHLDSLTVADARKQIFNPTLANLAEVTNALDETLYKIKPRERTLYRGKSESTARIPNAQKYVEANYSLGQEVVFDGYQSASLSAGVAADYACDTGIVFEMKTISGANVVSISEYDHEQEILLPRQTRWKVVGVHYKVDYLTEDSTSYDADNPPSFTVVQMIEINDNGDPLTDKVKPEPIDVNNYRNSIIGARQEKSNV
jgi:hypothetical protein